MPAGNMGSCSCGIPLSYPKAFPLATSFFLDHSVFINDLKLPVEIRRSEFAAMVFTTAERNPFFSIPISTIRRRAKLPPPLPGQPGPFSVGAPGALDAELASAGFREVQSQAFPAPLRMQSAAECVRFERESFGALHEMMSAMSEAERQDTWAEVYQALQQFESAGGFEAPCDPDQCRY